MQYAIETNNLNVSYANNKVLENVNLNIPVNTRTAIIGANGAGKSTLIKSCLGLIRKDSGQIKILGKNIEKAKTNIAYVAQKDTVNWNFPTTVYDVVMMGRYPYLKKFQKPKQKDKDVVIDALNEMGIADLSDRPINNLSGGQKQRVFLARALAQDVDLYILDEPLTGVDIKTEDIIAYQFKKLQGLGKTIIAVHHNIYTLEKYFDNVVVLNRDVKYSGTIFVDRLDEKINQGFRG